MATTFELREVKGDIRFPRGCSPVLKVHWEKNSRVIGLGIDVRVSDYKYGWQFSEEIPEKGMQRGLSLKICILTYIEAMAES